MPRGKWIDKKSAQHFTLVHRQQNDPLIHDTEAPAMVLNPTNTQQRPKEAGAPSAAPSSSSSSASAAATADAFNRGKNISDLADELGSDVAARVRANEGEAASYGVYYDDTEYDYMQHLRDLDGGSGGGDVVFVEAKAPANKDKGKNKMGLEDALRTLDLDKEKKAAAAPTDLLDDDLLPSKNLQRQTYQAQQAVPDALAGFNPDMDPRLREVLEALEDDAYVDDGGEGEEAGAGAADLFGQLTRDGRELDDFEFEDTYDEFGDDDGWESDGTAKPSREYRDGDGDAPPDLVPVLNTDEEGAPVANDDWMEDFKAFKKDQKAAAASAPQQQQQKAKAGGGAPSVSDLQSSLMTTTTNGGRRKKRKGALTDTSSYSMTSSSLVRTEQMGILDARFEKISEQYEPDYDEGYDNDDDDFPLDDESQAGGGGGASVATGASTASTVGGRTRGDFDGILDDFLGGFSTQGKRHPRKPGISSDGLEQLDQIRRDLGPARVGNKYAAGGPKARAGGKKAAALAFGAPARSR